MQPDPKKYKVKTIDVLETVLIIHENEKSYNAGDKVSQFVQIKLAGFFTLILNGQSLI